MQTSLLMMYVTLEQENAIRHMYLQRGWTFIKAGCMSSEKQSEVRAYLKSHLESLTYEEDGKGDNSSDKEIEKIEDSFKSMKSSNDFLEPSYTTKDDNTSLSKCKASIGKQESSELSVSKRGETNDECSEEFHLSCNIYKSDTVKSDLSMSNVKESEQIKNAEDTSIINDDVKTPLKDNFEFDSENDDYQVSVQSDGEKGVTPSFSVHQDRDKITMGDRRKKRTPLLNSAQSDNGEKNSCRDKKVKSNVSARKKRKNEQPRRYERKEMAMIDSETNDSSTCKTDITARNKKHDNTVAEEQKQAKHFREPFKSKIANTVTDQFLRTSKIFNKKVNSLKVPRQIRRPSVKKASDKSVVTYPKGFHELNIIRSDANAKVNGATNKPQLLESTIASKNVKSKEFKCSYCNKLFSSKIYYDSHIADHEKHAFDCPECGKQFSNRRNLHSHMYSRSRSNKFTCDICDFETTTVCLLRTHKRETHPPESMFQCHLCAKIVKTKSYLNVHLQYVHKIEDGKYNCPMCGRNFKRLTLLAKHKKDCRDRQCTVCDKIFRTKSQLRNHMRYHNERTYLCDFCGKGFATRAKLQEHHMTHTGVKPYQCSLCDYKSTQRGNLRQHMKVHQKDETKQKEMTEHQDDSNYVHKQICPESERETEDRNITNWHPEEKDLSTVDSETTKALPSYAGFLDTTVRSSSIDTLNGTSNGTSNDSSNGTSNETSNSTSHYNYTQEAEMPSIPTVSQTFPGVQTSNVTNHSSSVPTNVCIPQHETTEKSNYQIDHSLYLPVGHSQNVAETESLKPPVPLPKITDLSRNMKHRKSNQTLYAAEHAEHVPVCRMSDVNNFHSQSSAHTHYLNSMDEQKTEISSQFSVHPLYSNAPTEEYSNTTQLAYSQSGVYGISGNLSETATQAYPDHYGMANRTEESIVPLNEDKLKSGNTVVNSSRRSTPLELDQTAALEKYGEPAVSYATASMLARLHYNKHEKDSNTLSQSLEYGQAATMHSAVQYAQANLLDEIQLSQARNSPNFYADSADSDLHTSIADASAMYHFEGKLDFTNVSQREYLGSNANPADFAYTPDQMLYERDQTGTEFTNQAPPSYTDLQPPEYTTM